MSITVIITRDDNGAPNTSEVYEDGVKFTVESGELNVISDRPQLVALYGSGNWLSVHVDNHVVVVTAKPPEDDDDDSGGLDFGDLGDSDSSDSDDDSDTSSDDSDTDTADESGTESTESDESATESTESDDGVSTE